MDRFGTSLYDCYNILNKNWKICKKNCFVCLVAVCVYLAGDGEGGGGQYWDHARSILYIFNLFSILFFIELILSNIFKIDMCIYSVFVIYLVIIHLLYIYPSDQCYTTL